MPATANVAANLISWTMLGPVIMFAIFGSVMWQAGHNGPLCDQTIEAWALDCRHVMKHVGGCQAIGIVGLVLMLLVNPVQICEELLTPVLAQHPAFPSLRICLQACSGQDAGR